MASAGGVRAKPVGAPLAGRRSVVTRPREQGGDLVHALQALGADVVHAPTIRIEPLANLEPLRRALSHLAEYRWTVFTSQTSVQTVSAPLPAWGISVRGFAETAIAAMCPDTPVSRAP